MGVITKPTKNQDTKRGVGSWQPGWQWEFKVPYASAKSSEAPHRLTEVLTLHLAIHLTLCARYYY